MKDLISQSIATVKNGGIRLIALVFLLEVLLVSLLYPVIRWIFHEALRAAGLVGVDLSQLTFGPGIVVTALLLFVIIVLAFWFFALQLLVIEVAVHQAREARPLTFNGVMADLKPLLKKLPKAGAVPLIFYLFLILPLTGFGFLSGLVQGISIPPFVSGELYKSTTGTLIMVVFMTLMMVLNLLLALSIPIFARTGLSGARAMLRSVQLMLGRGIYQLPIIMLLIFIVAGVAIFLVAVLAFAAVVLSDNFAADLSPLVAAIGFAVVQLFSALVTAVVVIFLMALLYAYLSKNVQRIAPKEKIEIVAVVRSTSKAVSNNPVKDKKFKAGIAIAVVALTGFVALTSYKPLLALSKVPDTIVLAHRGFTEGGVENTLGALEAAAAAEAEFVEMDVMQTKDGGFVVMHDADLERLAGIKTKTQDLTLAELTEITVVDSLGHTGKIPSLAEYINRAAELEMPLLIEIKLGGQETPDHVELLVAELESLGALHNHMYHTLDPKSVATLKHLRPDLTVGYIMPFAGIAAPETPADFIVVEEWTASAEVQQDADNHGLGFAVWTINEEESMRKFMRQGVDAMITDHPDLALQNRASMQNERGLADVLKDALQRFITIF